MRIADRQVSHLWHCFGTERHRASLQLVVDLLRASRTNVLAINTHSLTDACSRDALEHGFSGVTYDQLGDHIDLRPYVKMLNINLRTTAKAALLAAQLAVELTGERMIKLEVLTPDLRDSRDLEVLRAVRELRRWDPTLIVMPLISCSAEAARRAVDFGAAAVRVMGSPISSAAGIRHKDVFEQICRLPVPVILDGGVGRPAHIADAVEHGADGVLINSALFSGGPSGTADPVSIVREFALAADQAFRLAEDYRRPQPTLLGGAHG